MTQSNLEYWRNKAREDLQRAEDKLSIADRGGYLSTAQTVVAYAQIAQTSAAIYIGEAVECLIDPISVTYINPSDHGNGTLFPEDPEDASA